MFYLLGTDEAGYGPNLGPLVVAGSLWRAPGEPDDTTLDLYASLSGGIAEARPSGDRLLIADSKQLYSSGDTLAALELPVYASLGVLNLWPTNPAALFRAVGSDFRTSLPWHAHALGWPTPSDVPTQTCHVAAKRLGHTLHTAGVELLALRAVVVQPDDFNARCAVAGNKANVLTQITLGLIRDMSRDLAPLPLLMVCDKHGGRNRYAPALLAELLDHETDAAGRLLTTLCEQRHVSAYRWQHGRQSREIRFVAKGERFLPAALASVLAKYLRELSLRGWNHFWQEQLPELPPTAGYPVDARRFRSAIEPLVSQWDWEESFWWRQR